MSTLCGGLVSARAVAHSRTPLQCSLRDTCSCMPTPPESHHSDRSGCKSWLSKDNRNTPFQTYSICTCMYICTYVGDQQVDGCLLLVCKHCSSETMRGKAGKTHLHKALQCTLEDRHNHKCRGPVFLHSYSSFPHTLECEDKWGTVSMYTICFIQLS